MIWANCKDVFGPFPRQSHCHAGENHAGTLLSWRNAATLLFGYEVESSESFPLCGELDAACLPCVLALVGAAVTDSSGYSSRERRISIF